MSKRKTLSLIFNDVEEVHLGKDVFLVPYYLGKALGYNVKIHYPQTETNKNLPAIYRKVVFQPIRMLNEKGGRWFVKSKVVLRTLKIFWDSDVLMLFHYYTMRTPYMGVIYKVIHPTGKLYVKMDAALYALKKEDDYKNLLEKIWSNCWHWLFAKLVDAITCETKAAFDFIMTSKSSRYKFRKDLFIMPNAFDNDMLDAVEIQPKLFEEKKNQFITVGRIGSPVKNTEMLLRALTQVDMKNWTMAIVGPYDETFANKIRTFFEENPEKKDHIVFTGNVSDKKQLWEIYNDSKVFVFTSRGEGSALVFVEATVFRNFVLSTDVGGFPDITENGKYGDCVPQDDDKTLSIKMQAIIDGQSDIDVYPPSEYKGLMWAEVIKPVAEKLTQRHPWRCSSLTPG